MLKKENLKLQAFVFYQKRNTSMQTRGRSVTQLANKSIDHSTDRKHSQLTNLINVTNTFYRYFIGYKTPHALSGAFICRQNGRGGYTGYTSYTLPPLIDGKRKKRHLEAEIPKATKSRHIVSRLCLYVRSSTTLETGLKALEQHSIPGAIRTLDPGALVLALQLVLFIWRA